MATQTGSYDFKSTKAAKETAEKVATNFVATDTSGMMVYDGTGGQHTPSNPGTNTRNVLIDSDSVDIRQGTTVLSTFGATTRIGKSNSENVTIGNGEVDVNTSTKSGAVRMSSATYGDEIRGVISLGGTGTMAPIIEGSYDTNASYLTLSATSKSNTSGGSSLSASGSNGGYARVDASATSGSGTCNLRANDNNNTSQMQVAPSQISLTSSDINIYGTPRVSRSTGYSEAFYYASHDTGGTVGLGVTSGGTEGVYSSDRSEWIIKRDSSGVHIGSSSTTPTSIEGSLTVGGSLTVDGHSTSIGWYDGHNATTSIASGTSYAAVSGSSITLSEGRYVLTASASFAGNTSGYRGIGFRSGSTNLIEGSAIQATIPSTSWSTRVNASLIRDVSSSETISLALVQNSGSSLSTEWHIKAIRIR